jgi:hypothetical protein
MINWERWGRKWFWLLCLKGLRKPKTSVRLAGFHTGNKVWNLPNIKQECEISGSHSNKYEGDCFWDVAPCNLVEVY